MISERQPKGYYTESRLDTGVHREGDAPFRYGGAVKSCHAEVGLESSLGR